MRYFTKKWYNDNDKYYFPMKLEIIKTEEKDIEKIFLNEYEKTFNKMKKRFLEKEQFDEIITSYIENAKAFFSTTTLNKIKDIRLLALGKVFDNEYDLIEKEIVKKDVMQAYEKYYNTIKEKLPKEVDDKLHLHDCLITNIIREDNKFIIELDCTQGFGSIKRIIFNNYKIQKEETNFINKWWLYEEIYIVDSQFELHIMTTGSREKLAYLTISAREIILE